jgi:hypothetical protein
MHFNELPKIFRPETLALMDGALEQAWQELKRSGDVADAKSRRQLRTTIVALASVGETDSAKLKRFALHAARH